MPSKNLCTEVSLDEFSGLILETEQSEQATNRLLNKPRAFFEERGYCVPPNARFYITPTEELRTRLQTGNDVNEFLFSDNQNVARFEVHIEKGKGKCTKIEVE
jgi:hypothetical protein